MAATSTQGPRTDVIYASDEYRPIFEQEEKTVADDPSPVWVEETDDTLGGCPILRVNGFYFVGEEDLRPDTDESRWSSDSKVHFIHKRRLWTRIDQCQAFIQFFDRKPYVLNEQGHYIPLSETAPEPDKG